MRNSCDLPEQSNPVASVTKELKRRPWKKPESSHSVSHTLPTSSLPHHWNIETWVCLALLHRYRRQHSCFSQEPCLEGAIRRAVDATLSSGDLRRSGGLQTQQQQTFKADRAQAVRQRGSGSAAPQLNFMGSTAFQRQVSLSWDQRMTPEAILSSCASPREPKTLKERTKFIEQDTLL